MKKIGLVGLGFLAGTVGVKLLSSKDAQKVYAHTTAAVLRMKDSVMKTVTTIREGAEDVYADAKDINEARAQQEAEAVIEDAPRGSRRERFPGIRQAESAASPQRFPYRRVSQ